MSILRFSKYDGAGNDFVMIDNRENDIHLSREQIKTLCHRRHGIGADGLIMIENHTSLDFRMVYYNSDGNESTMCGNGGRCIVAYAKELEVIKDTCRFMAIDGAHDASVHGENVVLGMTPVGKVEEIDLGYVLDTGSPHYVKLVNDVTSIDVRKEGGAIRYGDTFGKEGINVNFVEYLGGQNAKIRTYERGVEDETFACGTGATAAAIALHYGGIIKANEVILDAVGGRLKVTFTKDEQTRYSNIWLEGSARKVFEGEVLV